MLDLSSLTFRSFIVDTDRRPLFIFSFCYMTIGIIAVIGNLVTTAMIIVHSVYRLSAYTLMANVAFADSLMAFVIGVVCGAVLIASPQQQYPSLDYAIGFCVTAASTAGSVSYACLGINRCIAVSNSGLTLILMIRMDQARKSWRPNGKRR